MIERSGVESREGWVKGMADSLPIELPKKSTNRKKGKTNIFQPLTISTTTFEPQR